MKEGREERGRGREKDWRRERKRVNEDERE